MRSGCHCRGCWSSHFKDWAKNDGWQRLCPFHVGSIARPPAKFVPTVPKSLDNLVTSYYYYFPFNFNFNFFTPRGGFPGWSAHCLPSPVEGSLWNAGFAHGPGDNRCFVSEKRIPWKGMSYPRFAPSPMPPARALPWHETSIKPGNSMTQNSHEFKGMWHNAKFAYARNDL